MWLLCKVTVDIERSETIQIQSCPYLNSNSFYAVLAHWKCVHLKACSSEATDACKLTKICSAMVILGNTPESSSFCISWSNSSACNPTFSSQNMSFWGRWSHQQDLLKFTHPSGFYRPCCECEWGGRKVTLALRPFSYLLYIPICFILQVLPFLWQSTVS
jgi:hypothetical protein